MSIPNLRITMGRAFLPVLHNTDSFVFIESPRGCLKTCSILHILMMRAAKWPGKRWYIWRSARSLLSTTVLPSFEEYVIPVWRNVRGMGLLNPNARPMQRTEYVFENGSVFIPVGLDDMLRGTSSEGAGGYLAEAIELHDENQASALIGMMRQPGVPFHQIIVDANPWTPGHWLNRKVEPIDPKLRRVVTRADYEALQAHNAKSASNPKQRWKRIVAKIMDNPFYFDADKWEMTAAGSEYLGSLGILSGFMHARWVDGEWKAADGSVYPEFDDEKHVCRPFPIPQSWPAFLAKDPGRDHRDATLVGVVAPNERLYIVAESITGNDSPSKLPSTLEQDARYIDKVLSPAFRIVRKVGDPHMMFSETKFSGSGETIAQQMRNFGHVFVPAPAARNQAEIAQQVEMVREKLVTIGSDGLPMLQVFDSCPCTINGFHSWAYVRNTRGEMSGGEDKFEDVGDDEMDALRMLVADKPAFEQQSVTSLGSAVSPVTHRAAYAPTTQDGKTRWYEDDDD